MIDYSEFIACFVMSKIKDFEGYLYEIFMTMDTDKDGRISQEEIREFFTKHSSFFQNTDWSTLFSQIDLSKDGYIDPDELRIFIKKAVEERLESKLKELESEDDDLSPPKDQKFANPPPKGK